MEKPDTSITLHRIAAKMRAQAWQTDQTEYRQMMLRAAMVFDVEADRLDQIDLPFSTPDWQH